LLPHVRLRRKASAKAGIPRFANQGRERLLIVELKVAKTYQSEDEPQLLNELKATGIKVGMLINFGRTKVEFKRMVF